MSVLNFFQEVGLQSYKYIESLPIVMQFLVIAGMISLSIVSLKKAYSDFNEIIRLHNS